MPVSTFYSSGLRSYNTSRLKHRFFSFIPHLLYGASDPETFPDVQYPLVSAAAELQRNVFLFLDERAVYEDINAGKKIICNFAAGMSYGKMLCSFPAAATFCHFFEHIPGKDPERLVRKHLFHPFDKRQERFLVFRFEGLSAQDRQAVDVIGVQ